LRIFSLINDPKTGRNDCIHTYRY